MKAITKRKGVFPHAFTLNYVPESHKLFSICMEFMNKKFTIKAVNEQGSSETVVCVCNTKNQAIQVIEKDLNGEVYEPMRPELFTKKNNSK